MEGIQELFLLPNETKTKKNSNFENQFLYSWAWRLHHFWSFVANKIVPLRLVNVMPAFCAEKRKCHRFIKNDLHFVRRYWNARVSVCVNKTSFNFVLLKFLSWTHAVIDFSCVHFLMPVKWKRMIKLNKLFIDLWQTSTKLSFRELFVNNFWLEQWWHPS